ncbi:MAG: hypothetical protein Q9M94_03555, partial [Candidatus Gracilibacteria bacterium]|nr:hypothetical protein [Candidatus Gracilibacteria bacterium]
IIPYKTSNYLLDIYDDDKESELLEEGELMCTDTEGEEIIFEVVDKDTIDKDLDGICDLSCKNTLGEDIYYNWNKWENYVYNQGDLSCRTIIIIDEPEVPKIFDGYTLKSFIQRDLPLNNPDGFTVEDIGKNRESIEDPDGNGISMNDDKGNCSYLKTIDEQVKCYEGFLSKYNIHEGTSLNDLNPAIKNGYLYAKKINEGRRESTNYNSLYNKDLIILSGNTENLLTESNQILEGGYINGITNGTVDNINGGIKEEFLFSDNDNRLGEGEIKINNLIDSNTKDKRQTRRETIKSQIQLSTGDNSLTLINNPTKGLNYLSYEIKKEDFYSLNGILRISKNPSEFFSNLKIQDPEDET